MSINPPQLSDRIQKSCHTNPFASQSRSRRFANTTARDGALSSSPSTPLNKAKSTLVMTQHLDSPRPADPRLTGTYGEQTQIRHRFCTMATHRYPLERLDDARHSQGRCPDLWLCRIILARRHVRCRLVARRFCYRKAVHPHPAASKEYCV